MSVADLVIELVAMETEAMDDGETARRTLIMTDIRDADGTMWRAVHLSGSDELVIEGHDLGPGVERSLGCDEYEFRRSLSTVETAALRGFLSITRDADLLAAVEGHFKSTSELEGFLKGHGIEGAFWSRMGD